MPCIRSCSLTAAGVIESQLQTLPASWGESLGGQASRCPQADEPHQGVSQHIGSEPGGAQSLGPGAPALPGNAQQQVLGAYITVAQLGGALLGKAQGGFRPGGEFYGAYIATAPFSPVRRLAQGNRKPLGLIGFDGKNIPTFYGNIIENLEKVWYSGCTILYMEV